MNCEKHKRLIVATLNVDTEKEKGYCIGCIEELEKQLAEYNQLLWLSKIVSGMDAVSITISGQVKVSE